MEIRDVIKKVNSMKKEVEKRQNEAAEELLQVLLKKIDRTLDSLNERQVEGLTRIGIMFRYSEELKFVNQFQISIEGENEVFQKETEQIECSLQTFEKFLDKFQLAGIEVQEEPIEKSNKYIIVINYREPLKINLF